MRLVSAIAILLLAPFTAASPLYAAGEASSAGHFGPDDLAVIVNEDDPLSIAIGDYYRVRRDIKEANVIRVRFQSGRATMSGAEFLALKRELDTRTPPHVQAYALTWALPYRVECMSITTAFAAGFDASFCSSSCLTTRVNPYFDSDSRRPFEDFGLRPAMSIAAQNFDEARALIDRGVASDGTMPNGTAYLVQTGDRQRDVRATGYGNAELLAGQQIKVERTNTSALENRTDVMFYFIGAVRVDKLRSNHFLPGAVADHLTSYGGVLDGKDQMSILRWLEAGATASYGAVVEPCNFVTKFPNPGLMMKHTLAGESLIEAYWKSVMMPGQGIFVGEPLAHPYSQ